MAMDGINKETKQITAFLSDYDGTLCPTTSIRGNLSDGGGIIPQDLEKILFRISERIPICIISSKDFAFLHRRARFANILSCVLGIETVVHNSNCSDSKISNFDCIRYQHLITSRHSLLANSKVLHNLTKILESYNDDISIENKYTSTKQILIGLTIDYRHLENWKLFKENNEPILREMIQRNIGAELQSNSTSKDSPFVQKYSTHPFLDVYGVECNKGLAFDSVLSQLEQKERVNVMYLGDSENDNPAFGRSDISIGICSDTRLNPNLDCKYRLGFKKLSLFLKKMYDNDFKFSEDLLSSTNSG